ncbi:hypothetical protein KIL84_009572 [Mauremys mutica]|uniref:Uncharacterized protein n=1 Tax=Mauremys mutica TaxID=74926 RepID=A0A9D3XKZ1_9SAUR|nr:hypothetical protein KIL84_009572 [Mauremys mutica]
MILPYIDEMLTEKAAEGLQPGSITPVYGSGELAGCVKLMVRRLRSRWQQLLTHIPFLLAGLLCCNPNRSTPETGLHFESDECGARSCKLPQQGECCEVFRDYGDKSHISRSMEEPYTFLSPSIQFINILCAPLWAKKQV